MCLLASNLMYAHLRDLRIIRLPLDWAAQAAYAQFDAPSLPACLPALLLPLGCVVCTACVADWLACTHKYVGVCAGVCVLYTQIAP